MIKNNLFSLLRIFFFSCFMCHQVYAQTNYMEQNFSGGGPFVNANPDAGQFSHLITTNAASSKFEFGPGYMDMTRLAATNGGLVRAVRAVPFSPNPETLYVQITFSVEEITGADQNALYFYSGENFSGTNSTFPPNANLFSRFTIDFLASSFVIHDIQTNKKSSPLPLMTPVTITWVLNNASDGHIYRKPESSANPDYKVMPGKYDLWVNETLLVDEASAYPGSSAYSVNKLSNFEIRFWTGVGRVRFTSLRIRDVAGILPLYLTDLNVRKDEEKALISWTTQRQDDRDLFMVKKSKDKISYQLLYTTAVKKGKSSYAVYDQQPGKGPVFYKVEQIDYRGNLIDQKETLFKSDTNAAAFIFPNPSLPELIKIKNSGNGFELLRIYNVRGEAVDFKAGMLNDLTEVQPCRKMQSGLYILFFVQNGKTGFLRFLVE